jgi:hypothetical protein
MGALPLRALATVAKFNSDLTPALHTKLVFKGYLHS